MRFILSIILAITFQFQLSAQADTSSNIQDTIAEYSKTGAMPDFAIKTPDGKWLTKYNLKPRTATLIFYFSPDCGHCHLETEALLSNIRELKKVQIIMVTSRPFEDMVAFAERYKIGRFPTVKIGYDPARLVTQFYAVKFTPFTALYDKKGKLVKTYDKNIDLNELIELVKK